MAYYETLWTRSTQSFRVVLDWTPDDEANPTAHMEPDLAAETREKLDSGEWTNCQFRVRVLDATGAEIGSDYLGGSIYADPAEFAKERRGSYFPQMVASAIEEARYTHATPRARLRGPGRSQVGVAEASPC